VSTTTLTSKGQLTLPKDVRDRLKLKSGDKLEVYPQEDGAILLQHATVDIKELYGLLPKPP
jgi:AbrB family looped-hinge helix DNA binding protein